MAPKLQVCVKEIWAALLYFRGVLLLLGNRNLGYLHTMILSIEGKKMSVLIGRVPLFIKGELNTIFRKIKKNIVH